MPEEITPQPQPIFEKSSAAASAVLEADMDRLAGEILKHKENPELQGIDDREIVKQALRSVAPVPDPAPAADASSPYLPSYVQNASPSTKLEIEYLVDMALREGIMKANAAAAKSSPFVLDAFHDALAGKLYPELQKRKLVD